MRSRPSKHGHWPEFWLGLAWTSGIAVAVLGSIDGVDPSRSRRGANYSGDLAFAIAVITIVVALLYLLLVPARDRAHVVRATGAALVALAAVGFMFVASTHAGAVLTGTFMWTLAVVVGTMINALTSIFRPRRKQLPDSTPSSSARRSSSASR